MCPKDVAYFCSNWLFLFGEFDRAQMNITLLEEVVKVWDTELCSFLFSFVFIFLLKHTPAGASTMMFVQYFQNAKSGKFQKFDYGRRHNIKVS